MLKLKIKSIRHVGSLKIDQKLFPFYIGTKPNSKTEKFFWVENATEKAESLASLFSTNSTFDDKGLNPPSYTPQTNLMSKTIFRPQIKKKAIKKLKSDSAADPDDIPPILIKKCAPELAPILSKLFSYESGIFPEGWNRQRYTYS